MRDEIDGRVWVANHEQFSRDVDDAVTAARAFIGRLPAWDGSTAQLLALIAAFAITALTFNTTVA